MHSAQVEIFAQLKYHFMPKMIWLLRSVKKRRAIKLFILIAVLLLWRLPSFNEGTSESLDDRYLYEDLDDDKKIHHNEGLVQKARTESGCIKPSNAREYTICARLPFTKISCGKCRNDCTKTDSSGKILRIPNVVHFVWFGDALNVTSFLHYLSLRSVASVQKPQAIYLYYNAKVIVKTRLLRRIMKEIPCFRLRKYDAPDKIFEADIEEDLFKSDVARLQILQKQGGIYLDLDVITLRPLQELRIHPAAVGSDYNRLNNRALLGANTTDERMRSLNAFMPVNRRTCLTHHGVHHTRPYSAANTEPLRSQLTANFEYRTQAETSESKLSFRSRSEKASNGIILSEADSEFLHRWLQSYRAYDPRGRRSLAFWGLNVPYSLHQQYKDIVHMDQTLMNRPNPYEDTLDATTIGHYDIRDNFFLHVHPRAVENTNFDVGITSWTEEDLRTLDSTYGQAARVALFGSTDLVYRDGEFYREPFAKLKCSRLPNN